MDDPEMYVQRTLEKFIESALGHFPVLLVAGARQYMLDTGLCAYLTEWSSPETLEAGAMFGPILETWIMAELLKSYWHNGRRAPFYYYRDKDKKEIDLLIVQDNTIYPLEFEKSASSMRESVRQFKVLEHLGRPLRTGGLICLADTPPPLGPSAHSIPITALSLRCLWVKNSLSVLFIFPRSQEFYISILRRGPG